MEDKAGNRVGF